MRVYIIGAGPGDPKLLTLRGAELIAACPVVLYTGSLVPKEVLAGARPDARVLDSAGMTLEQIMSVLREAQAANQDVARVHTGDPLIFGSTAEQMRRMDQENIAYEIVPGVSSFTAAAAALGRELTLPELSQTVILTRAEGRTPMPEREKLAALAEHQATLALFLSITLLKDVTAALIPAYGADCPVAVVHKASCPDQQIVLGTLENIRDKVRALGIHTQSMVIVGRVLTSHDFAESRLYDAAFTHRFRRGTERRAKPTTPTETAAEVVPQTSATQAAPSTTQAAPSTTQAAPSTTQTAPLPTPTEIAPQTSAPFPTPEPAPALSDTARASAEAPRKGLLLVYTGHGKGKTTAALGAVFRALGRGFQVAVVQFIKGKWKTGERLFAETLPGLTFLIMGQGFTWDSDDLSRDRSAAQNGWGKAKELIMRGEHQLVVLDEITYAINYGFIDGEDVLNTLRQRPAHVHVIVTGRNAPSDLAELADLVTEMKPIKHPFTSGSKAQIGIDF